MANDNFDFELTSGDELEVDLGAELSEKFGLSSDNDMVLGDTEDLSFDLLDEGEEENVNLGDEVLLKTTVSVVDNLVPYAQRLREAMAIFRVDPAPTKKTTALVVPHSEFPYMPDDVFVTFHEILLDIAKDPENLNRDLDECAKESMEKLYEATHWSAKLNTPEYLSSFKVWCGRFRVLSQVKPERSKSDITNLMSETDMTQALQVFEINTAPFTQVTQFFTDGAAMASQAPIEVESLGMFTQDYMARNNLTVFTVKDGYTAIQEYISEEETRTSLLKLSTDEVLEFSIGELLRRLILAELNTGIFYPYNLRSNSSNEMGVTVQMLTTAMRSANPPVTAEMIYIIATMMLLSRNHGMAEAERFLHGIHEFVLAFLDAPALVNPVFYGHVKHLEDGYELSYVAEEKTYDVHSKDILCDVVGDSSGTRCIPKVLVDMRQGFTVCPPPQLVTPLRQLTIGGKNHVSGAMCYRFSPTISWLMSNKILAEECTQEETGISNAMQFAGGSLMQTLLEYDNKFATNGCAVQPAVISVEGYIVNAVSSGKGDEALNVCCVTKDGNVVSNNGTIVFDRETGNVILSFISTNGDLVDLVAEAGKYSEEYLGVTSDSDDDTVNITDFVFPATTAKPLEYGKYQNAVENLCELAALDYEEELANVQQVIARDLYYIACIPSIDSLVASRILQAHREFALKRKEAGEEKWLDLFNLASFQELYDIVCGRPNDASGFKTWEEGLKPVLEQCNKTAHLTVDSVCNKLDSLNFDKLALQVISRSELKRDVHLDAYLAIRHIPEIGSRLRILENKMIALRVLEILGSQVVSVFSKRSFLVRAYTSQLMKENVDIMNAVLVEKSRKRDIGFTLPLSRAVLEAANNPDSVVFKYFVLERNAYGLLSAMQTAGTKYEELCHKMLSGLSLPEDTDVTAMTSKEFLDRVGEDKIVSMCNEYRSDLIALLEEGLVNEVMTSNGIQLIKAYDLFNSFYDLIVGTDYVEEEATENTVDTNENEKDFVNYAGSLVVSYAPITNVSAGDVDCGADRFATFVKSPHDFCYDVPVDYLRAYDLTDVRLVIGE